MRLYSMKEDRPGSTHLQEQKCPAAKFPNHLSVRRLELPLFFIRSLDTFMHLNVKLAQMFKMSDYVSIKVVATELKIEIK